LEPSFGGGLSPPHPITVGKAMMITAASAQFVKILIGFLPVLDARAGHARAIARLRSYTRNTLHVISVTYDWHTFVEGSSLLLKA
jgi:hypothetical protein